MQNMSEIENDIGTAIMRLRRAFQKHGIPCPDVLSYSDMKKSFEAWPRVANSLSYHCWDQTPNAEYVHKANIAGMSVVFGAKILAECDGSFSLR